MADSLGNVPSAKARAVSVAEGDRPKPHVKVEEKVDVRETSHLPSPMKFIPVSASRLHELRSTVVVIQRIHGKVGEIQERIAHLERERAKLLSDVRDQREMFDRCEKFARHEVGLTEDSISSFDLNRGGYVLLQPDVVPQSIAEEETDV